jgi:hypothetical protein
MEGDRNIKSCMAVYRALGNGFSIVVRQLERFPITVPYVGIGVSIGMLADRMSCAVSAHP